MLAMTAMTPRFAYNYHEQKTSVYVLRIHVLHVMKKKPHLHDGTVMVDTDKNRLVEIPPSSHELPDIGIWDSVNTSNASKGQQKTVHVQ